APVYDRPYKKPGYIDKLRDFSVENLKEPADLNTCLFNLLNSPNVASKRWVYEQYDYMVRTNTVVNPGSDSAVLRIKESDKGIALSSDCNPRYCYVNPKKGGSLAVAEAARNVAMSGAKPLAITNCLNFGNPEKPEIMWQFVEALEGMKEACLVLSTPVVSGNVSFYNETEGKGVYPTPTIVMVGAIDDVTKAIKSSFKSFGSYIIIIGKDKYEIGASEYLKVCHSTVAGDAPEVDLDAEKKLIDFMVKAVDERLINSAHDISEGGLAVALAEMTLENEIGCEVAFNENIRSDLLLFSETQARAIVEVNSINLEKVEDLLNKFGLYYNIAGKTLGNSIIVKNNGEKLIDINVLAAKYIYENAIKGKMQ
ncbi:MAG: phosphoribosylformylglycinamidine synthase II, partial [Deferribacterales bacterium]|nr:phosphoribosylformylglycinamidine synthase II [Deferribacterales bacterium]